MRRLLPLFAILLPLALASCRSGSQKAAAPTTPTAPGAQAATGALPATGAPPADNKVHVEAFVPVSTGCRAETLDLLNQLATRYQDRISLEIIDFTSDEGMKRWQEAGLNCLTILFDGSYAVVFDAPGGAVPITFQMPPGINWTHEDLEHAFAAAAIGKLRPATEDEIQAASTPREYPVKFTAQESRDLASGKVKCQVLANGKPVAEITEKNGANSPKDRANKAARVLSEWVKGPIVIGDLRMEETSPGRETVLAAGAPVMAATEADAKAASLSDPKKVATIWLAGIKSALLAAVPKTPPTPPIADAK